MYMKMLAKGGVPCNVELLLTPKIVASFLMIYLVLNQIQRPVFVAFSNKIMWLDEIY